MAAQATVVEDTTTDQVDTAVVEDTSAAEVQEQDNTTAGEVTFTAAQATEYLGKSVAWLNEERKNILRERGVVFGGRGRGGGAKIPKSLLDNTEVLNLLGWKETAKRGPRNGEVRISNKGVEHLQHEVDNLNSELTDAKQMVAGLTVKLKEKTKELRAAERKAIREAEKAEKQADSKKAKRIAELRKAEAAARREAERLAERLAKLEAAEAEDNTVTPEAEQVDVEQEPVTETLQETKKPRNRRKKPSEADTPAE